MGLRERLRVIDEEGKVYVDMGPIWLDPVLYYVADGGEIELLTIQSGEYENLLGEFFIHPNAPLGALNKLEGIIEEVGERGYWTYIKLKREYKAILEEYDKLEGWKGWEP